MVTFGVLGPLTAENEHGPARLKGPRHRAVLARLLIARGRVVPVSWLIGDLWEAPQPGALGAVQTFVGELRKALEPARPPRTPSRLLVTSPPGYALRADPEAVDAWRFESALTDATRLLTSGAPDQAHALLGSALGLWRGPAYAEFAELDWARGEAARLDELRLLAVERRAEAAMACGDAAGCVPDLEAHIAEHPLREDGWRLLGLALYRAGRQGDALGQLRRAREVLREELGVDPGEGLRRLESDILTQAPHLNPPPHPPRPHPSAPPHLNAPSHPSPRPDLNASSHPNSPSHLSPSAPAAPQPSHASPPAPYLSSPPPPASQAGPSSHAGPHPHVSPPPPLPERPPEPVASAEHPFVGRATELAELEAVAAHVTASGRARLVLVSGAAGAGKTALARTLTRRLEADGWTTAWGTSPEVQGAPSAWPWTELSASLPTTEPPAAMSDNPRPTLPDAPSATPLTTRFRRHRAIATHLTTTADRAPLLLVLDDLHWADEETLALLTTLATDLGQAPVLLLATYRSTEISAALSDALGRAARAEPARVYLGGLTHQQVHELVQALTGRPASDRDARTIHTRSAGNPFFVRELVRLWESEGDAALHTAVPAGVRDVIRHRLAGLTETARTHLRQAAVLGQEVDLDVLIPLAGDEESVLESVESALLAGFLVERDADRLRFAHALVHETLYDDVTLARRARWHARVAGIVEGIRPGDVETIAHHCVRAEGRAGAARTAHYTRAAALRAEARSAPHEAARLWRAALTALDQLPGPKAAPSRRAPGSSGPGSGSSGPASDWSGPGPGSSGHASGSFGPGPGLSGPASGSFGSGPGWSDPGPGSSGSGPGPFGPGAGSSGPGGGAAARLEAVMGLVRALAVIGELHESRRYRAEAVDAAEALGDPLVTAGVIGSFDVPAIWTTNDDPALSARLVAAAERTLAALPAGEGTPAGERTAEGTPDVSPPHMRDAEGAPGVSPSGARDVGRTLGALPSGACDAEGTPDNSTPRTHDAERARLLITIAMERRADPGPRGDEAAREAEVIARRLGDRTLLAYALNGRYMQTFHRAGLALERAVIGEELVRLAEGDDGLATFEVLGHLILLQSSAALADLEAADQHAAAADHLAERYDLPLVGVFTTWYAALRRTITGDGTARQAYRAAAARLSGTGMPGVEDGMLPLALLCLEAAQNRPPEDGPSSASSAREGSAGTGAGAAQDGAAGAGVAWVVGADLGDLVDADWGPYEAWARPLILLAQGHRDEATAAAREIPDSPHDLLLEARTCLHALTALETAAGHRTLERLYDRLLPAEAELAGAGSGLLTLGPVAGYLGSLATALGRHSEATEHFRRAAALARKQAAGSPI
ncbi:hypothetical protein GCM10009850_091330 [Nonomuraea monospora]|uniref:OmpR/PhoB-type domain-containing protein n=1 Tax=Nonomuraea monospora TaxID=568818 RepID=A0ABN3CW05_9ACTN